MKLLEENKDNSDVADLISQLDGLKTAYDKITITSSKIQVVPDEESNVTLLKSESKIDITPAVFKELQDKVKVLRTNFVS